MNFDFDHQQTRDAFRLGLQSAVAATLCYIIIKWMGSDDAFLAVLSAVLIVQPSIGRTVSAGWERLLATLVGSAIGLVCLFLLPNGYGVAVALAIVMFVMNFIAGFRSNWRYGVVAAVALALADTSGDIDVAQARAIAIGIGIVVGIGVSLIVWPESAAKRAARHRRQALRAAADRYEWALKDEEDSDRSEAARQKFHQSLSSCRTVAGAAKSTQKDRLHATIESIQELYNSIIFLDRVDSPLSRFDESVITRDDLIKAGRTAIEALSEEDHDGEADDAFEQAIDNVDDSLSGRDLQDADTKGAASVAFALREISRCIDSVRTALSSDNGPSLTEKVPSKLKEIMP
jgi:uncharacterized membrane protein YccC